MITSTTDQLLLATFAALAMGGIGASLHLGQLSSTWRDARPFIIGLCSQTIWMPAVAFALTLVLNLPDAYALGLMIVGCCPSGVMSNFFSYLGKGDVVLSVSMTAIGNLLSVLTIPILLFAYSSAAFASTIAGPSLLSVVGTVAGMLVPLAMGIALRSRSEFWANRVELVGRIAGLLFLACAVGLYVFRNAAFLLTVDSRAVIASGALGPAGLLFGYWTARAMGLSRPQRQTISYETGIQNVPLAAALVLVNCPTDMKDEALVVPVIYGLLVLPITVIVVASVRWWDGPSRTSEEEFIEPMELQ